MRKEFDYLPWNVFLNSRISYYVDMLESSEFYGDFKPFAASVIDPYYRKLGWIEDADKDQWGDR